MNAVIKIDNIDISDYASINKIPVYARNIDFSQIFESIKIDITEHYDLISEIKENSIVEIYIDNNIVYVGKVKKITNPVYYTRRLEIDHIALDLQGIKILQDVKDIKGVFRPQDPFDREFDVRKSVKWFLMDIFTLIGYEDIIIPDNIVGGADLFDLTLVFYSSLQYVGQSLEWDSGEGKYIDPNNPDDSPTLFEILHLIQKIFHFKVEFGSLFDATPTITIKTPGYYLASTIADPDSDFDDFKNEITISGYKNKKEDKDFDNQAYIITINSFLTNAYENLDTEFTLTEYSKKYTEVKLKERKIEFPDHFIFCDAVSNTPNLENLPFAFRVVFNTNTVQHNVVEEYVSNYARWIFPNDYTQIGSETSPPIYRKYFKRNSTSYAEEQLYTDDSQITNYLDKFPKKIYFLNKEELYEIQQDSPIKVGVK